jgi:hypothetical protein
MKCTASDSNPLDLDVIIAFTAFSFLWNAVPSCYTSPPKVTFLHSSKIILVCEIFLLKAQCGRVSVALTN